jgi:hypothetical protein
VVVSFQGLLIGFGYQLWVLFEGWGLKEPGLRLADRGSMMGWQSYRTAVLFGFNMSLKIEICSFF